jgi:integrase
MNKDAGWNYKTNVEEHRRRDLALASLLYLCGFRVSEALRLRRKQIVVERKRILVLGIALSKSRYAGKNRREQFRQEARISLKGERANIGKLFLDHVQTISDPEALLFPFGRSRAWQIIETQTGEPCHWLRAYCENYLYDKWKHDLLAVADYVKVTPATLSEYIRESWKKYRAV